MIGCDHCGELAGEHDHRPDCPYNPGRRVANEMVLRLRAIGEAWDRRVEREGGLNQPRRTSTLELRMRRLGVPREAIELLRTPMRTRAREAAEEFLTAPHTQDRFILLAGDRGLGKTVAAAWMVRQQLQDGQPNCFWVPATDFITMSAYDGEPERLERVTFLVVDDLGRESKGFARELLSGVLMRRYENLRRTVLTTNASAADVQALYGPALWDRLRTGMVVPLDGGPSLRTRGGAT